MNIRIYKSDDGQDSKSLAVLQLTAHCYMNFYADNAEAAKHKAASWYQAELERQKRIVGSVQAEMMETVRTGRGAPAGLAWMRNGQTKELVRITKEKVDEYIQKGYYASGPRGK